MSKKIAAGGRIFRLLKQAYNSWSEDNCLRLSAALAYYSIFSIAPLLIIAISIAGLVFGAQAAQGQIEEQMKGYVGAQAAQAVQTMVQSAWKPSQSWTAGIIGVVTLLVGASGVFGQLKDSLNTIWHVKQKPGGGVKGFLRERFLTFGMVFAIGFLLLVSLMLSTGLSAADGFFGRILHMPPIVWTAITSAVSLAVVVVLFATLFKVLPDAQIQWRDVWVGSAVTALLFEAGKLGLSWYLGRASTASSYGAAGSVVLLLLWVYYASVILFFGAEFTKVYAGENGGAIKPSEKAELVAEPVPVRQIPAPHHESLGMIFDQPTARKTVGSGRPLRESLISLAMAVSAGLGLGVVLRFWENRDRPRGRR